LRSNFFFFSFFPTFQRRYISRTERSEEFLDRQAENGLIEFIEEGRWVSSVDGKEHLCADAWYGP
jgi:hypothetical protein